MSDITIAVDWDVKNQTPQKSFITLVLGLIGN